MISPRLLPIALLMAGVSCPAAAAAQAVVQPIPGTTDADRLADAVRKLGANPRDLGALIEAGELSVELGDTTAAAALFKRAEAIDPNNGRVKAGIARILVNGEHPGEALRYFQLAERYGAAPAQFADDRGLAYDLIGEQDRAQRDYRLALSRGDDDEVRRRYALSLGISGQRDAALEQIDTLLRKSDRGAWRARAFILAMNGDAAGANRIATTMMPPGMATGLAAFFQRLPSLGAADRAFAVHFGEVSPTPTRLADARMTPPLPVLSPDPNAPRAVEVTAVTPQPTRERRRGRDRKRGREAAPTQVAAVAARSQPQVVGQAQPVPAASAPAPSRPTAPTQVAAATARPPVPVPQPIVTPAPVQPQPRPPAPVQMASVAPAAQPAVSPRAQSAAPTPAPVRQPAPTATVTPSAGPLAPGEGSAAQQPVRAASATPPPLAAAAETATTAPSTAPPPVTRSAQPVVTAAVRPPRPAPLPAAGPPKSARSEDDILARIVANITVPGAELGVRPLPGREPAPAPSESASLDEAAVKAERSPAVTERRQRLAADVSPEAAVKAAERAPVEAKATRGKAPTRTAEKDEPKKAGTRDKAEDDEGDTKVASRRGKDAKKPAKVDKVEKEPARIWVQVAGGAHEADLPKAWAAARAKSPALAKRAGYSTPLRATNRVVTGPFKTDAEARAMVNQLAKQGLSAFTFTSAAGQKMTKLEGK